MLQEPEAQPNGGRKLLADWNPGDQRKAFVLITNIQRRKSTTAP